MTKLGIDWDDQPLGQMYDTDIAKMVGCSVVNVTKARQRRNIPRFSPRGYRSIEWFSKIPAGVIAALREKYPWMASDNDGSTRLFEKQPISVVEGKTWATASGGVIELPGNPQLVNISEDWALNKIRW